MTYNVVLVSGVQQSGSVTHDVKVAQSCLTLCDPMDCSPAGSSVHGILQARILSGLSFPFPGDLPWPRDLTQASHIAGRFFTDSAIREVPTVLLSSVQSLSHV